MPREKVRSDSVRLTVPVPIEYSRVGRNSRGVAVDLSPHGLRLRTDFELRVGQVLEITMNPDNHEPVMVLGEVRWVREVDPLCQPRFPVEAGLLLIDVGEEYNLLYNEERSAFINSREDTRFEELIRCEVAGPGTWEASFALNVSRRGIFVKSDVDLENGDQVQMRLFLPDQDEPVVFSAEVVHKIGSDDAEGIGSETGLGLRITRINPSSRKMLDDFIDTLETARSF